MYAILFLKLKNNSFDYFGFLKIDMLLFSKSGQRFASAGKNCPIVSLQPNLQDSLIESLIVSGYIKYQRMKSLGKIFAITTEEFPDYLRKNIRPTNSHQPRSCRAVPRCDQYMSLQALRDHKQVLSIVSSYREQQGERAKLFGGFVRQQFFLNDLKPDHLLLIYAIN